MDGRDATGAGIPVFYINLQRDEDRLTHFLDQSAGLEGFAFHRVAGIEGACLPDLVTHLLVQDRNWQQQKGAIGCFLSHVAAWEKVAADAAPFSIVLEDDVQLSGLVRWPEFHLPEAAELIFINDRMAPQQRGTAECVTLPIDATLRHLDTRATAMGADGYILYRDAARKLLAAVERDLCYGHVDGRLLRYCVSDDDLAGLAADSWIAGVIRHHHNPARPPASGILKAYCAYPPMVTHGGFPSTREMFDKPGA